MVLNSRLTWQAVCKAEGDQGFGRAAHVLPPEHRKADLRGESQYSMNAVNMAVQTATNRPQAAACCRESCRGAQLLPSCHRRAAGPCGPVA